MSNQYFQSKGTITINQYKCSFTYIPGARYGVLDEDLDDMDIDEDLFAPQMPSLTPADVDIQPSFQPISSTQPPIIGRLLTPAEGCGISPIATTRIGKS